MIYRAVVIHCDRDGCPNTLINHGGAGVHTARQRAQNNGWSVSGGSGIDYCPDHAPKTGRQQ